MGNVFLFAVLVLVALSLIVAATLLRSWVRNSRTKKAADVRRPEKTGVSQFVKDLLSERPTRNVFRSLTKCRPVPPNRGVYACTNAGRRMRFAVVGANRRGLLLRDPANDGAPTFPRKWNRVQLIAP